VNSLRVLQVGIELGFCIDLHNGKPSSPSAIVTHSNATQKNLVSNPGFEAAEMATIALSSSASTRSVFEQALWTIGGVSLKIQDIF
jgi:hypothetical protein